MPAPADRRLASLRAALGFFQLAPRAPELRLLHRWLDTWTGVGLLTVGVERFGHRLSLTHVAEGEGRVAARSMKSVLTSSDKPVASIWRRLLAACLHLLDRTGVTLCAKLPRTPCSSCSASPRSASRRPPIWD
jgi:hypothetical protein